MARKEHPDCFRCAHFRITWEPGRPYACVAMNFKSALMPWQEVIRASGQPCLMYKPRRRRPS
jgi:hypothetical protein